MNVLTATLLLDLDTDTCQLVSGFPSAPERFEFSDSAGNLNLTLPSGSDFTSQSHGTVSSSGFLESLPNNMEITVGFTNNATYVGQMRFTYDQTAHTVTVAQFTWMYADI